MSHSSKTRLLRPVALAFAAVAMVCFATGDVSAQHRHGGGHGGHSAGGHHGGGHYGHQSSHRGHGQHGGNVYRGGSGFSLNIGSGYGHSNYYRGASSLYRTPSYYNQYRRPTWHNTSHYDYHPTEIRRHGNHYDVVPGHYDLHRTGHWDH